MKKMKKLLSMLLILTLAIASLSACGTKKDDKDVAAPTKAPVVDNSGEEKETTPTATPEPTEEPEPVRDLGGIEVTIANWWAAAEQAPPTTTYEEDLLAYREEIQKKYNFTIKEVKLGEWGEWQELYSTSVNAGDPEASIYVLDSRFVPALLNAGLFYPVSELGVFDFTEEKWNPLVYDALTFNGVTYGFQTGYEPRTGIFFNKRLFEEAGLDPNLPYDLQASGQWTWDKLKEISKQLTYDKDNDGIMDTYAFTTMNDDLFVGAIFSNGAQFVGKDENGYFYNATNEPQFLESLQWTRSLFDEGYVRPAPEGAEWNWFEPAFLEGQGAMRVAEEYVKNNLKDMKDDFGFVMFPSKTGELTAIYRENVLVIPSTYDKETAEKIAFAYNLYNEPLAGYEDDDNWKLPYYSTYRDSRAVDETLELMRNGNGLMRMEEFVYGLNIGEHLLWDLGAGVVTPVEAIEGAQQIWNTLIDDANGNYK